MGAVGLPPTGLTQEIAVMVPVQPPVVVTMKKELHGQIIGMLAGVNVIRSATGDVRTKYVVRFRHNRTAARVVDLAVELDDIAEMK